MKVIDLYFTDDVAILYEFLETLVVVLEAFSNESKPRPRFRTLGAF